MLASLKTVMRSQGDFAQQGKSRNFRSTVAGFLSYCKIYKMKILKLFLLIILFASCQSNVSKKDSYKIISQDDVLKCNKFINPEIEIWNHTGTNFVIGNWENREDKYLKSEGWDLEDFPFPKKFDLKLILINNLILYDNPIKRIGDWYLSVSVKFKVGQSRDAVYPLNAKVYDEIKLIKNRLITDINFSNKEGKIDQIEIWRKDIELESFYYKYKSKRLFLNQLIFEIHLTSKQGGVCNYEYIFPMVGSSEI